MIIAIAMFNNKLNQLPRPKTVNDLPPPTNLNIDQWIKALQRSDRLFYNMMALEVWSIAKTMDKMFPGFWHRFMANRQEALKQFMQQKKGEATTETPNFPKSD